MPYINGKVKVIKGTGPKQRPPKGHPSGAKLPSGKIARRKDADAPAS